MGELIATLLGHRLNLKCQDSQTVEHRRHTIGQHTEIFSTTKHATITEDIRQTVHRLIAPEEVMALEIIIIVESHEGIFILIVESLVDRFAKDADTRMIHLRLFRILEEEHIADEPIETVANPKAVLIVLSLEESAHLQLGIILSLEVIESIASRDEEVVADIRGMHAEEALQHTIIDKRAGKEILAERQPEVLYLANGHRDGRREMSQEPEDCIHRNLPDTEEPQHMIDADGIEILLHPAQTAMEPVYQVQS